MAEVDVDKTSGRVQVKRLVCTQDMGLVINPQGAKLQMEGCITMGLGYVLTEEIHFRGGEYLTWVLIHMNCRVFHGCRK